MINILNEQSENFIEYYDTQSNLFCIFTENSETSPEYITSIESTANRLLKEIIENGYDKAYIKELQTYIIVQNGKQYLYGPIVLKSITQPSGNDQIEQEKFIQIRNEKEKTEKILEKISKHISDEDLQFIKYKLDGI